MLLTGIGSNLTVFRKFKGGVSYYATLASIINLALKLVASGPNLNGQCTNNGNDPAYKDHSVQPLYILLALWLRW